MPRLRWRWRLKFRCMLNATCQIQQALIPVAPQDETMPNKVPEWKTLDTPKANASGKANSILCERLKGPMEHLHPSYSPAHSCLIVTLCTFQNSIITPPRWLLEKLQRFATLCSSYRFYYHESTCIAWISISANEANEIFRVRVWILPACQP